MNYCLLLTLPHHHSHFPLLSSTKSNYHFSFHQCCINKSKWDPNAESFRTHKKNFDFNFKNNPKNANRYYYDDVVEEEDEDDDDNDDIGGDGIEVLEEYIDSIWIFKVFGTYGWALPIIIFSMLLASGPKAFLMALALPLGQSTFSFALQKLWGSKDTRSKRKMKTKKRSRTKRSRTVKGKKTVEEKMGYQSWVPGRDFTADKPDDDRGASSFGGFTTDKYWVPRRDFTADKPDDDRDASSFGGWDELDRETDFGRGSSVKSDPTVRRSRKTAPEEGKFSTTGRKGETPLLLRLLVSAFPFLSSWTKML